MRSARSEVRRRNARGALTGLAVVGLLVAAAFLVVTALATAQGCSDSWTGGAGSTTWDSGANWSTGKAPTSTDSVCITLGGTYNVVAGNETIDVASLTVGGAGSDPTLMMGSSSAEGTLSAAVSGPVVIASTGTLSIAAPGSNYASFTAGSVTNAGTFSVLDDATLTLAAGSTFDNAGGTISTGSGTFMVSTPSNGTATVKLESGGVLDNAGSMTVSDTLEVNGGSICGNALHLGTSNSDSGALVFPDVPGTGPACAGGVATDDILLLADTTLSGTIPASYTVDAGGPGDEYDIALSGDVINDGTFEPGTGFDAGLLSAGSASDYLTNNGTVTMPAGGTFNTSLINNGALNVESQANVPVTVALQSGWSWENTSSGTITISSVGALDISSPSGQSAPFVQDGLIENSGTFNVGDPITINGGTICENPVKLGSGDETTGTFTLSFATNPSAGPACGSGQATDQLFIYNVAATIESNIPTGYTIAMGDSGSGFATVGTRVASSTSAPTCIIRMSR